ncbi:MAG: helix-turn-helix domain-containing protein [Candidatus Caenarcaniphilales bacterium]|jgi:transposase-like protein|nr:helix-turn-helix domain-containing protein [Candidatus Caenarcaniphilales bacterium]
MSNKKLSKEDIETIKKRVESGERVSDLAKEYDVVVKTIHYHIGKDSMKGHSNLSQARLIKENQELKLVLAETMLELDKEKKRKLENALKRI